MSRLVFVVFVIFIAVEHQKFSSITGFFCNIYIYITKKTCYTTKFLVFNRYEYYKNYKN